MNTYTIGKLIWGIDGKELPSDMTALGVPVSFPEMNLGDISKEECEITVSASLYEVPEDGGSRPDQFDNMGISGPIPIAEGELHYAYIEGGVARAFLFPETMIMNKHYAIIINAVTVYYQGEIIAELPEDAYYSTDFYITKPESELEVYTQLMSDDDEAYDLIEDSKIFMSNAKSILIDVDATVSDITYNIYKIVADGEKQIQVTSGEIQMHGRGYAEFNKQIIFGHDELFKIIVKCFRNDEELCTKEYFVIGTNNHKTHTVIELLDGNDVCYPVTHANVIKVDDTETTVGDILSTLRIDVSPLYDGGSIPYTIMDLATANLYMPTRLGATSVQLAEDDHGLLLFYETMMHDEQSGSITRHCVAIHEDESTIIADSVFDLSISTYVPE